MLRAHIVHGRDGYRVNLKGDVIAKMISNRFKTEVGAMISKDLEYLTEQYVPMKLKNKKMWLG